MNYELLKHFLAVAKFLNFTRAAEFLYTTQPTLSKHIAALEDQLGVKLFVRKNHSLALTEAGKYLSEEGNKLLDKTHEIETKILQIASGPLGKLTLQSQYIKNLPLTNLYNNFYKFFPEIDLVTSTQSCSAIINNLLEQKIDIGIIRSCDYKPKKYEKLLEHISLYRDHHLVALPHKHPLANKKNIKLSELSGMRFLYLDYVDDLSSPAFSKMFEKARATHFLASPLEFDNLMYEVKKGNGIALLDQGLAESHQRDCAFVEIKDYDTSFDVLLLYNKQNTNPALKIFLNTIPAHF